MTSRPKINAAKGFRRVAWLACALAGVAVLALGQAAEEPPRVVRVAVDSIIQPVAQQFLAESLAEADRLGAELFVIELSTPGGLLTSTREIVQEMLGAETPVVVYVSPKGSHAASAGFFLLMAADLAAMAPGTNTGAATPVGGQGEDVEGDIGEKVKEDAAAQIRSLAARNGRDADLAESAVLESKSFTAEEALEAGLVDLIAEDFDDLLAQIDGRALEAGRDEPLTLRTADADVRQLEMSQFQRLLSAIAHPNIAFILMSLGMLGLTVELYNPGAILPGVVGAICLIMAFYALSVLPVNYAGVALILLAIIFFIAEIKVVSYGLLSVGGLISLVLGSLMLFKSADPAIRVSLDVIVTVAVFTLAVVGFLLWVVLKVHRSRVTTGAEGLVSKLARARTDLDPRGKVFVWGEIWHAVSESPVPAGQSVEITAVEGMTLRVRPVENDSLPDKEGES